MILWTIGAAALACGGPSPGVYADGPAGWTADGRWFAFEAHEVDAEYQEVKRFGVVDTQTDQTTILSEAKFAAWKAEHALEPLREAATCGGATLIQEVESLLGYADRSDEWLTLGVQAAGQRWVHAEMDRRAVKARPAWSPDCRFVAWVLESYRPRDNGVGPYLPDQAVLVRPAGPVIHIMAHASLPAAVDPILAGLKAGGFSPHVGPNALKDRDATVVYASAAAREVAGQVAAAVPGGAAVDALTWPSAADIVVAAGRSALSP